VVAAGRQFGYLPRYLPRRRLRSLPKASPKRSEAEHRRTLARIYYGLEAG
jgi:hypothetical protein